MVDETRWPRVAVREPADLLVRRHRHGMLLRDWVLSSRMSVPLDLQRLLLSSDWAIFGKPVSEVLLGLLDRLGGNSSTIDEADARQALSDLQEELFAEATDAEKIEAVLLDAAQNLENLLERFFGYYIFEQFSRVSFERLVQRVGDLKATSFLNSHSGIRSIRTRQPRHREESIKCGLGGTGRCCDR